MLICNNSIVETLHATSLLISNSFKRALFPDRCLVCSSFFHLRKGYNIGSLLQKDELGAFSSLMSHFLCLSCAFNFEPLKKPFCIKCGRSLGIKQGDICHNCIKNPDKLIKSRSGGIYSKSLMEVIHAFKYRDKIKFAKPLGKFLFLMFIKFYAKGCEDKIDYIVPVPLHKRKFRQRGFNQAYLLIKDWHIFAQQIDFPVLWQVKKDLLIRKKWTKSQTTLDAKARLKNVCGAFVVNNNFCSVIENKNILIVDDVYTTGATARECADVLLNNGAKSVALLTLAST